MMQKTDSILVTGGHGLVGSAIVDLLKAEGYSNVVALARSDCDLTNTSATRTIFAEIRPRYVIHTAARVYGIMGNMKNKALSFYDNVMINTNVIDAAHRAGVEKITAMGTGAIYPYPSPGLPLREDMIFLGSPHPAEDSYASAKRAMLSMLKAYEESFGMKWAYLISCNLFGPRDKFDPEFGHVTPALIKKFYDAKSLNKNVSVWGDGSARRDFMYVEDAARAVVMVNQGLNGPVNLGSGDVLSIRSIVEMIANVSGMNGRIEWDTSKPNGQDYRAYDLSRLSELGFSCRFSIAEGIRKTWEWYVGNQRPV